MGWAVGYDKRWQRDIGYGVPATCDGPGCREKIDRGLGYVCGGQPFGGSEGCGLFFCDRHGGGGRCWRCQIGAPPYDPTPDLPEWTAHKMTDPSWARWRSENGIPEPAARG
jgi:hypothetical protein